MIKDPPSLLEYQDYRQFLKDAFEKTKANQTRYSYRQFAKDLGFGLSNYLHLVIHGQRNLSEDSSRKICQAFGWTVQEKEFFRSLVRWNQCEDLAERKKLESKLNTLLNKRPALIDRDRYHYFSQWYLPVIREIISFKKFVSNLNWISRKLRFKLDEATILEALKTLERLNMIEKIPNGWKQKEEHLATESEVPSALIFKYHEKMLELSQKALDFPSEFRDFSAMTISFSEKQFQWLKKRLGEFREEIQQELQNSQEPITQVAQLNMQFFALTKESS